MTPKEPTGEQCNNREKVFEAEGKIGYAIWYPQMGGYVGKAVALVDKHGGGCIDVYVWHNGEFPFSEDDPDISPAFLHHCDPKQFIEFGATLAKLNAAKEVPSVGSLAENIEKPAPKPWPSSIILPPEDA